MRRPFLLLLVLLVLLAPSALATSYPDPQKAPRYFDSSCIAKYDRRFVYDYQSIMDPGEAQAIEDAACFVYANTSAHFVLVTVNDTGGEVLENYALHLFETWGIGQKAKNDGVMLLYVEHYNYSGRSAAVRLEVGYGLEGAVDAHESANAVRAMQDAKQRALDGGYSERAATSFALSTGSEYVLETLDASYVDGSFPAPSPASGGGPPTWFIVLIVVIFVLFVLANAFRRRAWGYVPGGAAWSTGIGRPWIGSGGSFGGGFGGGGFGGGGFGGGRSGGGGGSGGL